MLEFFKQIINIRKSYVYLNSNIINCDETPIFLDSPESLSLAKKREQNYNYKNLWKRIC